MSDFSLQSFVFGKESTHIRADAQVDDFRDALQAKRPATAALGRYGKLSIVTPMDRTELWIAFAPTPALVGIGAGGTLHSYSAWRNFIRSSGGW
jgi:hypothetical protein